MSIKRSKQRSYDPRKDEVSHVSFNKKAEPEVERTWEEHMTGQPEEVFIPYSLNATFTKGTFISHEKFGKGIVLSVDNSRIELLFSDGKKKLAHKAF